MTRIALTYGGRTIGFGTPQNLVYAGIATSKTTYRLFKTTDGGESWAELPAPPSQEQLHFNNVIAVGPYNEDDLYIGQVGLWKANDGGRKGGLNDFEFNIPIDTNSWYNLSCCLSDASRNPLRDNSLNLHADIHDIVFAPYQSFLPTPEQVEIIYVANDGGVTKGVVNFEGTVKWEPLTLGLAIGQASTIALNPQNPSITASGLWHNGNAWTPRNAENSGIYGFGDGMHTAIDAGIIKGQDFEHQIVYYNCNAGFSGDICRTKITSPTTAVDEGKIWSEKIFSQKFWSDPYRSGHLLRIQSSDGKLYRTKKASMAPVNVLQSPSEWEAINPNGKKGKTTTLAFRSALLDSVPVYYIGTDAGQIWRGSPEIGWTKVCECGSSVQAIAPDLLKNERIFAVFSASKGPGRIKELTKQSNGTWTIKNIDNRFFPEFDATALSSIVMDPLVADSEGTTIYVGTNHGVYRGHLRSRILENAFAGPTILDWEWSRSPGIPNVAVMDMEVHQSRQFSDRAGVIRAGTYGRGVFELKRTPDIITKTYPYTLEVAAMQEEVDGAPPSLNVKIEIVTSQKKLTKNAPFKLTPAEGTVTLEAPIEVPAESGILKLVGWVISGKRQGEYNKVTFDVKQTTTAVAYYKLKKHKADPK